MSANETLREKLGRLLVGNAVPIVFLVLSAVAIPLSGFTAPYLIHEMMTRLARDSFLVLSLLIPIAAGMGLNFGMVLGAMAGQIGLILVTDWGVVGLPGILLACLIGTLTGLGSVGFTKLIHLAHDCCYCGAHHSGLYGGEGDPEPQPIHGAGQGEGHTCVPPFGLGRTQEGVAKRPHEGILA